MNTYTLADLAEQFNLEYRGDASTPIRGIAKLGDAGPDQLAFLFSASYKQQLEQCQAAAVVLKPEDADLCDRPVL